MIQGSTQVYFTQDELIQIYQHAGSAEQNALLSSAKALFPDRMAAEVPPLLKAEPGIHGRWFIRDEKTGPEEPVITIKSGHFNWIGILEDGTALPY